MIGEVAVGEDAPISVQSMTNTKAEDVEANRAIAARCDVLLCHETIVLRTVDMPGFLREGPCFCEALSARELTYYLLALFT